MPDHPADVGGRPERVAGAHAKDHPHRIGEGNRVPAIVAHDPLRPPGRARGVDDIERIGRRHRHAIVRRARGFGLGEVLVASGQQLRPQRRPLLDEAELGLVRAERDRGVEQRLVGDDAARLQPAGGREDRARLGVGDPARQLRRREAAEHDRVDGAEPRAGQHGDDRSGDHRHVDHHPVAAPDPARRERPGQPRHPVPERAIADRHDAIFHRAVPDQGRLLAASGGDVAVEAVVAGVEHPAREPLAPDPEGGIEGAVPAPLPVDLPGGLLPPPFRVAPPGGIGRVVAGVGHRLASKTEL